MKIIKTANYKKIAQNINESWGGLSGEDLQNILDMAYKGVSVREAISFIKPDFNEEKFRIVRENILKIIKNKNRMI